MDDAGLLARQDALRGEAALLLSDLDVARIVGDLGPVLLAGSYVSGLMCWPEVDVMVHVGPRFSPVDVLRLLHRVVERPGVVGFDYRDERGARSPTGTTRDERYHVAIAVERPGRAWQVDLTLWLNDPHHNITAWHEALRDTITAEQRGAVLRIKDAWLRRGSYPHQVGGVQVYAAVLDDGVRTPEEFASWLSDHG